MISAAPPTWQLGLKITPVELECYFLRCQELDRQVEALREATAAPVPEPEADPAALNALHQQLAAAQAELQALQGQRQEEQRLLSTAQAMLEGQARYLEDVSLREEQAAQAVDRLRLLQSEILYYIRHSQPLASLDIQRINRLVQLAKQPDAAVTNAQPT